MRKITFVLFLFIASKGFCQDYQDRFLCDASVALSSPIAKISVVENNTRLMTGRRSTAGRLALRNEADSAIVEYAFLLEAFDSSHNRLYGLVFHDSVSEDLAAPSWMLPVYKLKSAIEPHDRFKGFAETSLINSHCPVSAVLSFTFVRFADGETVQNASRGWRSDPSVGVVTDHLDFENCEIPARTSAVASIELTSEGTLQSLHLQGFGLPPRLTRCLKDELIRWEFLPAKVEGHSISSKMKFVVLFNPAEPDWMNWEDKYSEQVLAGVNLLSTFPYEVEGKEYWTEGVCCYAGGKERGINDKILGHVKLFADRDPQ